MQKELDIGVAAVHKIIDEELHMKKIVCRRAQFYATFFGVFAEFRWGQSSILNEEVTGIPMSAIVLEQVPSTQKMSIGDNRSIYQTIQKELNVGAADIHKIIHEERHMKKFVCHRD